MQTDLLPKLQQLLAQKQSKRFYAQKLGVSELVVDELLAELRKEKIDANKEAETGVYISALEDRVLEMDLENNKLRSVVTLDYEPKSVEELYELHKIDREKYKISNYWSKLKSTGKFTSSVFATAKKAANYTPEDFARFLSTYQAPTIYTLPKRVPDEDGRTSVDVEISIADFHLAKKTLEPETIAERKHRFLEILTSLTERVHNMHDINKLVFVISNDFFHTDNYHGTTTNGTPQDVLVSYDEEYE